MIQYPGAPPRPKVLLGQCDVDILDTDQFELAHCRDIGDAFVGDTGSSSDCGEARVRRELMRAACHAGANAIVIRPIDDPHSDCHQARARLLLCTAPPAEEAL